MAAAAATGRSIAFSSFLSSSNFSHKAKYSPNLPLMVNKFIKSPRTVRCFAVQESSAAVAAETKEDKNEKKKEEDAKTGENAAPPPPPPPPKPAPKAAAKPLPQLMEEDVIPALSANLQAQPDITQLELSFQDNTLEGSFLKNGYPYCFWAFFPDGVLTGSRGFSLSAYGSGVSTVEPFMVDEKKITANQIVFWVGKRLAAQGLLPVWQD